MRLCGLPNSLSEGAGDASQVQDLTFARPLGDGPVYRVRIHGLIDAALARYVERAMADAGSAGASVIILDVNTFGGLIEAADEIRAAILDSATPTVAFVNHNAASAGALIAYAADRIVMAPGSSIGAATAVDAAGEYASGIGGRYLGLAQCYAMFDEPHAGAEVFSLVRTSALADDDYSLHSSTPARNISARHNRRSALA